MIVVLLGQQRFNSWVYLSELSRGCRTEREILLIKTPVIGMEGPDQVAIMSVSEHQSSLAHFDGRLNGQFKLEFVDGTNFGNMTANHVVYAKELF